MLAVNVDMKSGRDVDRESISSKHALLAYSLSHCPSQCISINLAVNNVVNFGHLSQCSSHQLLEEMGSDPPLKFIPFEAGMGMGMMVSKHSLRIVVATSFFFYLRKYLSDKINLKK
jgi:hypothetical protein